MRTLCRKELSRVVCPGLALTGLLCGGLLGSPAWAGCLVERGPDTPAAPLTRHLAADCTEAERAAQAIPAAELLAAFKAGRGVDLERVLVLGDLALDQLPLAEARDRPLLPGTLGAVLQAEGREARILTGPVILKDCVLRGSLMSHLKTGVLAVTGPVILTGTRVEGTLDLSRVAFGGPLDLSHAVLLGQGLFVHAWFSQPARFDATAFGVHTRFHRATFMAPVTYRRAVFKGLAEFLEVQFQQGADFGEAAFAMGTGFSGSRFNGPADFSGARFDREAFFTFTVFEKDATFRRTMFGAATDFSDAQFHGAEDFSGARFGGPRRFVGTQPPGDRAPERTWQFPALLGILLALGLAAFWLLQRSKRTT